MSKATFQRSTTARVLVAAPELRFVASYNAHEERLKACMNDYERRSFVYVLTVEFHGTEHYIYVGKSKAQYARLLMHLHRFEFDYIYLFECQSEELARCEIAAIRALTPLFNRHHNPLAERNRQLLCIAYDEIMDAATIRRYLALQESYNTTCLYGFALPGAVFSVLNQQAEMSNCTCSELLQQILERTYPREIAAQIPALEEPHTNLVLPQDYAKLHHRSKEQIKAYCHKDRLPGAVRIGRDWIFPVDTRFPEDHRRKGAK